MISAREVSYGLFGAWRLAHLDPAGMRFFDTSIEGFWRSFWAAAIAAPMYFIVTLLQLSTRPVAAGPVRIAFVEIIGYVIAWTAFPLVAWYIVSALGRAQRYLGYIVAFNWANVLQVGAYLALMLIASVGGLPSTIVQFLGLAVALTLLFYYYYIARTALGVDAPPAIGLVLADMMLTLLRDSIVSRLEAT